MNPDPQEVAEALRRSKDSMARFGDGLVKAREVIEAIRPHLEVISGLIVQEDLAAITAHRNSFLERFAGEVGLPVRLTFGDQQRSLTERREEAEYARLLALGYVGTFEECQTKWASDEFARFIESARRQLLGRAGRAIEDERERRQWRAIPYEMRCAVEGPGFASREPRRIRKRIEQIMGLGLPSRCRMVREARVRFNNQGGGR